MRGQRRGPQCVVTDMKRKKVWIPIGVAAALLVLWAFIRRDAANADSYRFVAVERGSIEAIVTSTGKIEALETVEVGTQVSGQIAELLGDFNDRVEQGKLLARIDPTILRQEVRSAEANLMRSRADLEQAERELKRARELHESRVMTTSELETAEYQQTVAEAAYASAEIALDRAKRNLAYTEIHAPIDGVVVERSVDVGQTVAASMQAPVLFVIARDLSEMRILADVDESDIGKIRDDQEVRFTVQAFGDIAFTGTVEQVRLQSTTQENVVSYHVVVRVENPDGRLLPGMTATVTFIEASADDVLKVPNAALRFQPTESMRNELLARRSAGDREMPAGPAELDSMPRRTRGTRGSGRQPPFDETRMAEMRQALASGEFPAQRSMAAGNRGMLWTVGSNGEPAVTRVRTGLTDGQYTAITGDGVREGMQVIAGIVSGGASATQATPNPFNGSGSSQRRMPGPPGGF